MSLPLNQIKSACTFAIFFPKFVTIVGWHIDH
jgi:hypothetical protein